jgi:uncharacterized membrane protein
VSEWLRLLWDTVLLRPYVFAFLLVFLVAAAHHLGWRRTLAFVPVGFGLAWLSEFASIHWGFPYGDYYYLYTTAGRELWVAGVPFMDSLSYVFLSYCAYATALFLLSPVARCGRGPAILETREIRRSWRTMLLGAFLFMFLDVIIDPVALRGSRWFLGQIYGYREAGAYFGVPVSNFIGWFLVGLMLMGALQVFDRSLMLEGKGPRPLRRIPGIGLLGPVLFLAVLAFNLSVTFWIGEVTQGMTGVLLVGVLLVVALVVTRRKLRLSRASPEAATAPREPAGPPREAAGAPSLFLPECDLQPASSATSEEAIPEGSAS